MSAYLVGSVPYGYLFGRLKGIDLRQLGSGNIGATNVWRVMGKGWGITAFILDFLKVYLAYLLIKLVFPIEIIRSLSEEERCILFLGAVVGHNYPIWLKFKGGKGIATSAGGLLWLLPEVFLVVLLIWVLFFAIFRYVSLASIACATTLPIATWIFYSKEFVFIGFSVLISLIAIWRHHSNIQRLIQGTEHRWTKTPKNG